MKRLILLCFAINLLASVFAYDFSVNGIYYKIKENSTKVAVTAGANTDSYSGDVVIPSSVNYNNSSYSVTQIYPFAFASCHAITSITIPNSVDSIEDGAFWGCVKLTSLFIPASVKKIGYYVFAGDTELAEINVAAENTKFKSDQGILYNKNMNVLRAYPAGKTASTYTISNTVDSLEVSAFSSSKFTSITIPNSVKYMAHATFLLCDGITTITLPSSFSYLQNNPFYYCKNMTTVNIDPANPFTESVDGVVYKKGLSTIIYYPPAKPGTSFIIPSAVTYIRSSVFMNCLNLTSITIPSSVETIRSGAFEGCSNLTTINVLRNSPVDLTSAIEDSKDVFKGVDTLNCILHVPIGSRNAYANAFQWKGFANIVEGFSSGISTLTNSGLKAVVNSGYIQLNGYPAGANIKLYDLQGTTLYNKKTDTPTTTIRLQLRGMYIVRAGDEIVKLIVK